MPERTAGTMPIEGCVQGQHAALWGDYQAAVAKVRAIKAAAAPFVALLQSRHAMLLDISPVFAIGDALITVGDLRRLKREVGE